MTGIELSAPPPTPPPPHGPRQAHQARVAAGVPAIELSGVLKEFSSRFVAGGLWLARMSACLFLILLPFFPSFALRTISWQYILADNGLVPGPLKSIGLPPQNFRILAATGAVLGGQKTR